MSKDPKKWIIAAIMAVVLIAYFSPYNIRWQPETVVSTQVDLVSLIKRVDPSVVYIEISDECGYPMWSGSGVIVSPDGLILTAGHVVDDAYSFRVVLPDGREFTTEKSYFSDVTDAGFIKIDAKELPVSSFGNSDNLKKGEEVFIIGTPLGYTLKNTVTSGIVSGLKRDYDDDFFGEKFLFQSDALSWPGNSGGPVYDMRGQIVGIVVGGYYPLDGISLCVPSNICILVMDVYEAKLVLEETE